MDSVESNINMLRLIFGAWLCEINKHIPLWYASIVLLEYKPSSLSLLLYVTTAKLSLILQIFY